jgi:hypothetical protein
VQNRVRAHRGGVSYLGLEGTEFEVQSFKFNVESDPGQPEVPAKLSTELELSATCSDIYDLATTEELGLLITRAELPSS